MMQEKDSADHLPTLFPPARFGLVENGVYRSAVLRPPNFAYVKQLRLRTVVRLSPEVPNKYITAFYEENGVRIIHLGLKALEISKERVASNATETNTLLTEEVVKEALEIILDARHHPLLLVCSSGCHHTGIVVACLRKLLDYNLTSILQEYRDYALSNTRAINEQFIELFDTDLVTLPPEERLPSWFLDWRRMKGEEEEEAEASINHGVTIQH
ncbi:tyrosine phosphatase [Acanthamoeba castellanii str. Neff]|jgi:protein tyrosine/serine phosphatase|uniref:Tyrosine phosphatase n=1 Tax=Acanthamoeba castellanii (strain ATCC 30010 / Neff) TaxID=1257118 RepID=L8GEB8_ACACF|nr:tyrosine phosphatase [Acanthamoeba castellanii str. Neff]ELR11445.1 tyrosine phosphatase [Acanthamoeba castellanii str. Neff]